MREDDLLWKRARAKSRFLIAEAIRNDSVLREKQWLDYMADVIPQAGSRRLPTLTPTFGGPWGSGNNPCRVYQRGRAAIYGRVRVDP